MTQKLAVSPNVPRLLVPVETMSPGAKDTVLANVGTQRPPGGVS